MSFASRLLNYVEIKTKITSVFPFLMTLAYLYYSGFRIDAARSAVFFAGMFCFDLTATTINNYCDTRKNAQELGLGRRSAKAVTFCLLLLSVAAGLYLVSLTDIAVLLAGAACFFFGIIYSFGPVPISHGPYGEVVSGFFYGFVIPALLLYINIPSGGLLSYTLAWDRLALQVYVRPLAGLILLAVLPFCLTANIMLANNICDVERDAGVGRYTLPYYIKNYALSLFTAFYVLAYLSVLVMVVLGYAPALSLLLFLTLPPVYKNIRKFHKKQVKEETFIVSIQNFLLIIIVHTVLIFLGGLIR